jgi:TrmH family RNA methyltransferase
MLENIKIVLVNTSHPGNIGAVARAMNNMCLTDLALVQPMKFPSSVAIARASGANKILETASVHETLAEAIADCQLIIGTSARKRVINWPTLNPKSCAKKILEPQQKSAIIFGREHSGLTNEELDQCNYLVQIPTNPKFSSLNIAAAVQVLAYEVYCTYNKIDDKSDLDAAIAPEPIANNQSMQRFYEHLKQTITDLGYFDPNKPKLLLRRLHRMCNRLQPSDSELQILRGILSAMEKLKKD